MDTDPEEEMLAQLAANERVLTDYALAVHWEMDVTVEQCDGCGEDHCESAWWWGHGWVFTTFDGFTVSYDPKPSDPDISLLAWDCDKFPEAVFLITVLSAEEPKVPMPNISE